MSFEPIPFKNVNKISYAFLTILVYSKVMQFDEIQVEMRFKNTASNNMSLVESENSGIFNIHHFLENLVSANISQHFIKKDWKLIELIVQFGGQATKFIWVLF